MFGFVVLGAVAVAWGVLVAVVDQPVVRDRQRVERWCAALLIASAAAVGTTVLGTVLS